MIYVGIPRDNPDLIMAYAVATEVFTTEAEMFQKIFHSNCTSVLLTDEFVKQEIRWPTLESIVREIRRIRPHIVFIVVGTHIEVEVDGIYLMKRDWKEVMPVLTEAEKLSATQIKRATGESNNILESLRSNLQTPDYLVDLILKKEKQILPLLQNLVNTSIVDKATMLAAMSTQDTLVLENSALSEENNSLRRDIRSLQSEQQKVDRLYNDLVTRINQQYSIPYGEENMNGFDISINKYDKILYIKELTRVHFVDTLLYYVQTILNSLNDQPTRYCVIEKEYSYNSAKLYPNHIPHKEMAISELRSADICMVGYQKDVLASILANPSSARYLIILDRSGHDFLAVQGDRVRTMYSLSDVADNATYGVPEDLLISYNTGNFYIPSVDNFEHLPDSRKVAEYSSMDITKSIIKAIEERD